LQGEWCRNQIAAIGRKRDLLNSKACVWRPADRLAAVRDTSEEKRELLRRKNEDVSVLTAGHGRPPPKNETGLP
jgi:hypothetical protein